MTLGGTTRAARGTRRCRRRAAARRAAVFAILSGSLLLAAAAGLAVLAPDGDAPSRAAGVVEAGEPFEVALPVNPYELDDARLERVMDLAKGTGANTITTGAAWWYVAPTEGGPRLWEPLDELLVEAEERGMKVRLQLAGTPDWVHPELLSEEPDHGRRIWHPPANAAERAHFEAYLAEVVQRYGTRISGYEIWNEPNYANFWEPAPDPAAYAELLRGAHGAVKGADGEARVVFGGISMNDTAYLARFYEAASRHPDAEEEGFFFDELSVHPYTYGQSPDDAARGLSVGGSAAAEGDPRDTGPAGLAAMKAVMRDHGDGDKEIFAGEIGYSTQETFMPAVSDGVRARHLVRALEISSSLPYVSGLAVYGFVPGSATGPEWTVLDENLRTSKSYRALAETAPGLSSAPPHPVDRVAAAGRR